MSGNLRDSRDPSEAFGPNQGRRAALPEHRPELAGGPSRNPRCPTTTAAGSTAPISPGLKMPELL